MKNSTNATPPGEHGLFADGFLVDATVSAIFVLDQVQDIRAKMAEALADVVPRLMKDPNLGWIPARHYQQLSHYKSLDPAIGESHVALALIDRLSTYRTALRRTVQEETIKRELARAFWKMCLPGLEEQSNIRSIFFEASSTITYCAQQYVHLMNNRRHYQTRLPNRFRLLTNSVITYLQFRLEPQQSFIKEENVELVPKDTFREDYGEAFGPIDDALDVTASTLSRRSYKIAQEGREKVKAVTALLQRYLPQDQGVVLMSTTEICIADPIYQGPVVNSYRNFLFKKALFLTGVPIVLFADHTKLTTRFDGSATFPILMHDLTWSTFLASRPACICVSVNSNSHAKRIKNYLHNCGLTNEYDFCDLGPRVIIRYNDPFNKACCVG